MIFLVILPRWDRKIGSDSLAAWLIVSFVLQAMMWFAAVFTCVINPIRVLIISWENIREMQTVSKIFRIIAVILPIPFIIPFGMWLYKLFYEH
ncbi:MAG: hypothetical protein K5697_11230 [Lachnospiraceae bacterium]|nr:hypothetical protein [Lachnospiraceae bacterium]